jgi:hypothetical protein
MSIQEDKTTCIRTEARNLPALLKLGSAVPVVLVRISVGLVAERGSVVGRG